MTIFTGWTGWLIFAAAIVAAWLLLGALLAGAYHLARCAYLRRQERLDLLIGMEESRIDRLTWPDDLCSWPPCEFEDNHLCTWHAQQLRGKHHPPPLTYGAEPIVAVVTDLPEPSDPRWSR